MVYIQSLIPPFYQQEEECETDVHGQQRKAAFHDRTQLNGKVLHMEITLFLTDISSLTRISHRFQNKLAWDLGVITPLIAYLTLAMPFRMCFQNGNAFFLESWRPVLYFVIIQSFFYFPLQNEQLR